MVPALVHQRIADECFVRVVEDDVLHAWQHKQTLVHFKAVLRQLQPQITRDIAHKHGGIRLHAPLDLVEAMRFGDQHRDFVALLHRVDLAKHRRLVLVLRADHDAEPRRIQQVIELICAKIQQRRNQPLRQRHNRNRNDVEHLLRRQRKDEVEDEVRQKRREDIGKIEFAIPYGADVKTAIGRGECEEHHEIQKHKHQETFEPEVGLRVVMRHQIQKGAGGDRRNRQFTKEYNHTFELSWCKF